MSDAVSISNGAIEIEGFTLPHVTVKPGAAGGYDLTLDRRFGMHAETLDEVRRWAWFLANAMAVAAGFTSFGENSSVRNDYGPSIMSHKEPVNVVQNFAPGVVFNESTPKSETRGA